MTQRLPAVLSIALLASLPAGPGAWAQDLPAATGNQDQAPREPPSVAKSNDGRITVTRSDGSTSRTKLPDPKEIRKLVNYMRDGMNRADRSEQQRPAKKVIYRRK